MDQYEKGDIFKKRGLLSTNISANYKDGKIYKKIRLLSKEEVLCYYDEVMTKLLHTTSNRRSKLFVRRVTAGANLSMRRVTAGAKVFPSRTK